MPGDLVYAATCRWSLKAPLVFLLQTAPISQNNDYVRQLASVVLATVMFVASVTFVSIPATLQCNPKDHRACAMSTMERHLT
jgi:hypothetical protein